jgi:hypothetical protein
MEVATFTCSICSETSRDICVYCTKDACSNHLCERCRRCSDCCQCEVALRELHEEGLAINTHFHGKNGHLPMESVLVDSQELAKNAIDERGESVEDKEPDRSESRTDVSEESSFESESDVPPAGEH